MEAIVFASLHHVAILILFAALLSERILLAQEWNLKLARNLALLDGIYGGAAASVLGFGLMRVISYEKGWDYYSHQHWFWGKMALFALGGVLSVYPTIVFLRWRRDLARGVLPEFSATQKMRVQMMMNAQIVVLLVIPVFAYAMARGY